MASALSLFGLPGALFRKGLHRWALPNLLQTFRRRAPGAGEPVHVLLCIADHYEPKLGRPTAEVADGRVNSWVEHYPRLFGRFRDSDGRPPRHTFFYPPEEYEPEYLDALAELCRAGFGEVEVHLHHDNDTADNLRRTLLEYRDLLAGRHGLLARRRNGEPAYAFIHGNWALCNSRPDGRWCGVNNELTILRETGCYVDMTMPSAPSPTQTRKINSIYYAIDRPGRPRSHERGMDAGSGPAPEGALLLIQGPLLLDWRRARFGIIPRIENACLQGNQAPDMHRLDAWLRARVRVPARPDWYFVKLHTHGAPEKNQKVLLGEPMIRFHEGLAERAASDPNFHYHYVTAREMYNLVKAAEAGWSGSVCSALDHELTSARGPSDHSSREQDRRAAKDGRGPRPAASLQRKAWHGPTS
jgi:hypothetical protein